MNTWTQDFAQQLQNMTPRFHTQTAKRGPKHTQTSRQLQPPDKASYSPKALNRGPLKSKEAASKVVTSQIAGGNTKQAAPQIERDSLKGGGLSNRRRQPQRRQPRKSKEAPRRQPQRRNHHRMQDRMRGGSKEATSNEAASEDGGSKEGRLKRGSLKGGSITGYRIE